MSEGQTAGLPTTQVQWRKALDALPGGPSNIPPFFFGHGSPMLMYPEGARMPELEDAGPDGPLATFLRDFGPKLLEKYKPKGIVVFSAHWETDGERLVTDYGDENPLLMDYFGFPQKLYNVKFSSRGDSALSQRVVELYKEAGQQARTSQKTEARGKDGRGFYGSGLDHGVFVPFRIMFGENFRDIPIVQVSIDESLDPEANWATGRAVSKLRKEGILILAGGLLIHNLREISSFSERMAKSPVKDFARATIDAMSQSDPAKRRKALLDLPRHPGFRAAHPREEHFVPLYVAAGAGEEGGVHVVEALYSCPTAAFGV